MSEDCDRCKWWNLQGLSSRCPPCDAEWAKAVEAKWREMRRFAAEKEETE